MKRTEEQYNEYITIIIEKSTGRADITLKSHDGNVYYYAEKNGSKWELKLCENGCCYNAKLVNTCKTLKECIEIIRDVCNELTVHYRSIEDAEAITDIEKDIAESVPIEETEQEEPEPIVYPVENEKLLDVLDKMHEIVANTLIDLNDVISQMKSSLNSTYGNHTVEQVIDAKNDTIRTELTGFHVSGVISETGIMTLFCDIYAQDLDIKESYLAYNVGNGYAVYDEISLTRIALYSHVEAVRQFFVNRFNELETRTIETLY